MRTKVLAMTTVEVRQFIAGMFSLAVYIGVAWAASQFFEVTFGRVFGALLAARAFFGAIETAAGVLSWRLFGRRATISSLLEVLRANNFPQRSHKNDNLSNYLARIEIDAQLPERIRQAAKEFERLLSVSESQGILAGMRMNSAGEAALEAYATRENVTA